ncbi:Methyltransferase domain-containing protein [Sphingomonas guangdongensis]|uniref:Methyltransferase domain-containing protein n=1 Tax=Sphingomonas guangdongensis TaxID=1141890 RepID=A0A285QKJ6_9SPHN|nr:class I SAM-dependent methyltransferase [Sphingomonas guangdongensis]SOB80592.1 Methyltransferase domain-containing protein [Sphingomonas guangdongensis]
MSVITQAERERLELHFWEQSSTEGAGTFSIDNLLNKMSEAPVFASELERFAGEFSRAKTVLELGGGQLWSSCLVKARYPDAEVIGSDISASGIASAPMWENIFRVKLDGSFACTSYAIPMDDQSCDVVYAFQAAHHFGDHARTLTEVSRILRPGGVLLYLGEPVCSRLTYPVALKRVNRIRPEVHEDLLILDDMEKLASANDMQLDRFARADIIHPTPKKAFYYAALDAAPILRRVLPSAMSLRFRKR